MVPKASPSIARRLAAVLLVLATALCFGFLAGRVVADQPHMHAALEHLRTAKQQLEQADADKGGHRKEAMRLVDQAVEQVELGIRYDRAH